MYYSLILRSSHKETYKKVRSSEKYKNSSFFFSFDLCILFNKIAITNFPVCSRNTPLKKMDRFNRLLFNLALTITETGTLSLSLLGNKHHVLNTQFSRSNNASVRIRRTQDLQESKNTLGGMSVDFCTFFFFDFGEIRFVFSTTWPTEMPEVHEIV